MNATRKGAGELAVAGHFAMIDVSAAIVWVPLAMTLGTWVLVSLLSAVPASLDTWV